MGYPCAVYGEIRGPGLLTWLEDRHFPRDDDGFLNGPGNIGFTGFLEEEEGLIGYSEWGSTSLSCYGFDGLVKVLHEAKAPLEMAEMRLIGEEQGDVQEYRFSAGKWEILITVDGMVPEKKAKSIRKKLEKKLRRLAK